MISGNGRAQALARRRFGNAYRVSTCKLAGVVQPIGTSYFCWAIADIMAAAASMMMRVVAMSVCWNLVVVAVAMEQSVRSDRHRLRERLGCMRRAAGHETR